jgi:lipoprotein-anchoring transpeptidase ErfK/SrfK
MLLFLGVVGYGVYRTLHTQTAHRPSPGIDTSTPEIELKIGQQIELPTTSSSANTATTNDRTLNSSPAPMASTPLPLGPSTSVTPPPLSAPPLGPNLNPGANVAAVPSENVALPPAARSATEPMNSLPSVPASNAIASAAPNQTQPLQNLPSQSLSSVNAVNVPATNNTLPTIPPVNNSATLSNAPSSQPTVSNPPIGPGLDVSPYPMVKEELKPLLAQNKLLEALQIASKIYDDARLAPAERKELSDLLNQLAGSVIYSRDHLLAKPHVVASGESLTTIAEKYRVPADLLAKINGYTSPTQLRAGDTLKVMQGPFTADVSMSRKRLTVFLNDCYAGSFELLTFGQDTPKYREQTFVVEHKTDNVQYRNGQIPAGDPKNPLGNFLMALNEDIAIHGVGTEVPPTDPRGSIRLSPRDVEDVYDILSVGSRVTIKR